MPGPGQTTRHTDGDPRSLDGVVVMLKVMALLAAYAIFVWVTMTQMERGYPVPSAQTADVERKALDHDAAVPGAVVIQVRSQMTASESAGPSRSVAPLPPGRAEAS